jgi:carbon storage regulator CsrA
MLVLSRKPGEKIVLKTAHGDRVEITVLDQKVHRTSPGKIRIGIEAPDTIEILREELENVERRPVEITTTPSGTVSLCDQCGGHSGDHSAYCPAKEGTFVERPVDEVLPMDGSPDPIGDWPERVSEGGPGCPRCGAIMETVLDCPPPGAETMGLICPECGHGEERRLP